MKCAGQSLYGNRVEERLPKAESSKSLFEGNRFHSKTCLMLITLLMTPNTADFGSPAHETDQDTR